MGNLSDDQIEEMGNEIWGLVAANHAIFKLNAGNGGMRQAVENTRAALHDSPEAMAGLIVLLGEAMGSAKSAIHLMGERIAQAEDAEAALREVRAVLLADFGIQ